METTREETARGDSAWTTAHSKTSASNLPFASITRGELSQMAFMGMYTRRLFTRPTVKPVKPEGEYADTTELRQRKEQYGHRAGTPAMAPCTTFCASCMQYILSDGLAGTLREAKRNVGT